MSLTGPPPTIGGPRAEPLRRRSRRAPARAGAAGDRRYADAPTVAPVRPGTTPQPATQPAAAPVLPTGSDAAAGRSAGQLADSGHGDAAAGAAGAAAEPRPVITPPPEAPHPRRAAGTAPRRAPARRRRRRRSHAPAAPRADHAEPAERNAGRQRAVHGADLDRRRDAPVDADAVDHLQPRADPRAQRAGRHVHAAGRRHAGVQQPGRRQERPHRHRRSRGPATRPAHRRRACWRHCWSSRSPPAPARWACRGSAHAFRAATRGAAFLPAGITVR